MGERHDVAILGGGLAGLTLALQLKRTRPETSVLVLEKREGPAPLAAFKVGESTLEIAGHYFADVCGLRDHLDDAHLWKLGLRYYFPAGDNRDIARRVEWGPPAPRREIPFRIKTYQIDRGVFENELADRCRAIGVDLRDGSPVQDVELGAGDADHRITFGAEGEEQETAARWIVGATGRAAFMKRKLGLAQDVEHTINASWLRLQNGLELDAWSDDEAWQGRMQQQKVRWLYTNHLMGQGYWVWLIPLGTGAISIGIVADPRFHPFERISTLEAALDWLDEHEPLVAEAVRSRPNDVQDFLRVEDYAYQVERVYSPERWCLTGDAGAFTDPFYSPGSDFIALGNTCITDLVVRDLAGEPVEERVERFNDQFLQQFRRQLDFYTDMYELWGNPQVMCAKVSWDLLVYWGLTSVRYVHGFWHDLDFSAETSELLDRGVRAQRADPALLPRVARDRRPGGRGRLHRPDPVRGRRVPAPRSRAPARPGRAEGAAGGERRAHGGHGRRDVPQGVHAAARTRPPWTGVPSTPTRSGSTQGAGRRTGSSTGRA